MMNFISCIGRYTGVFISGIVNPIINSVVFILGEYIPDGVMFLVVELELLSWYLYGVLENLLFPI